MPLQNMNYFANDFISKIWIMFKSGEIRLFFKVSTAIEHLKPKQTLSLQKFMVNANQEITIKKITHFYLMWHRCNQLKVNSEEINIFELILSRITWSLNFGNHIFIWLINEQTSFSRGLKQMGEGKKLAFWRRFLEIWKYSKRRALELHPEHTKTVAAEYSSTFHLSKVIPSLIQVQVQVILSSLLLHRAKSFAKSYFNHHAWSQQQWQHLWISFIQNSREERRVKYIRIWSNELRQIIGKCSRAYCFAWT